MWGMRNPPLIEVSLYHQRQILYNPYFTKPTHTVASVFSWITLFSSGVTKMVC